MHTPNEMGTDIVWTSLAYDRFQWEKWGEQYAIFDSFSGETHLLPFLTAHMLQALARRECSTRHLVERLRAMFDDSGDERIIQVINQQLKQLQALGLVEMRTQ